MKKKPSHVTVKYDRKYNTAEKMIRRFLKLCKKERIVEEYKDGRFFKSNSQKRRDKIARSERRRAREEKKSKRR